MSWMGRVNYSYKGKYLATASLRYDGASRLAEGHKWVMFPSGSLAWRISDEDFLQGTKVFSNLKLRASYGTTGNYSVGAYSTIGKITSSRYNWGKTEGAMGYAPSSLNSPSLTWEKSGQTNIGLDMGFLDNRISATVEVYRTNTSDLLLTRSLPTVSGFGSITQNIGETRNQGIELTINTINFNKNKFKWTTDLTGTFNKEEIVALATGPKDDIGNRWFIGRPVSTFYDYVAAPKVWGYSAEDMAEMAKFNANGSNYKPGDLRLVDYTGDYKITDLDRKIRGSRPPKFHYSMANTFTYGPFDLYVFMHGAAGFTINWDPGYGPGGRYNTVETSYWTPKNTNSKFIAPHTDIQMPSNVSAMYYWKGDFLKIDDISLGYTLPSGLTNRVQIDKVRLYAKIQNPFIFTKFEGNDPEGSIGGGSDQGWTMKYYMFGVNLTF
jgi:TonB-linked SusC/RagA family outer membrane protein